MFCFNEYPMEQYTKKMTKTILAEIWETGRNADEIIDDQGLVQNTR